MLPSRVGSVSKRPSAKISSNLNQKVSMKTKSPMKTPLFRPSCLLPGLLAGAFIFSYSAQANSITWNGTDATWATGTNWVGNTAPADDLTTDIAVFNSATYTAQPNAGTTSVNGIEIGASSAAVTLSGTALTIGSGGVTMASGAAASSITAPITLGAAQTWDNSSANQLTVGGTSGAFALTKTGTGTIQFNGAVAGSVTVNGGTVNANALNSALGSSLTINNGGTVVSTNTNGTWFTTDILINSGGLLTAVDNNSSHIQYLTLDGGTLSMGTATGGFGLSHGNWNFDQAVVTLGTGKTSTISGSGYATLSKPGGTNFVIGAGDTLNVTAALGHSSQSPDNGLIKQGAGLMTLSATNTYTSNTVNIR